MSYQNNNNNVTALKIYNNEAFYFIWVGSILYGNPFFCNAVI